METVLKKALNIEDLRLMSKKRLTRALFEFIDRGSEDDIALKNNKVALERIKLLPRVLEDVSERTAQTKLFGKTIESPLVIGPTGPAGYVWYRGEIKLAKAACSAGVPFTLSSTANTQMERIIEEGGGSQWYQLYVWRDIASSLITLKRAYDSGFEALVLTVDSTVPYNREFDIRNGATFPVKITTRNLLDTLTHPRWMFGTLGSYLLSEGHMPRYVNIEMPEGLKSDAIKSFLTKNDTINWDYFKMIRDKWPRTLLIKGVLHPKDALMAAELGADGVIVSNHGGIANDAGIAPIDALPDIVSCVGNRMTVLVDSGFRRGSDILKGLALGANAVMIGRPTLYGLSAAGEAGALRALKILQAETLRTMAVMGVKNINSICRDHVVLPNEVPNWSEL